ncbi:MAG: hypothetical protein LBQ09_12150, partial [Acidobacteriaceae bacterium]|nr:hypothetical protein [Acidobacteriaceae bacterium]
MALVICATVFAALAVTFTVACSGTATKDTAPPAQTAAPVDPATTGTVSGTVPGAAPSAIATLTPSGNEVVPPPPTTPVMDQIQLSFVPGTL